MSDIKIECPKCKWQPKPHSVWGCSCGNAWNTFDTGGRCPKCGKLWEMTQCHSRWEGGCEKWSPHLAWYKGLEPLIEEEVKEVEKGVEIEETVI